MSAATVQGELRPLRRTDLPLDTVAVARYLIGQTLVHDRADGRRVGRIVETEAYGVGDEAGHAFRGQTPRNRSLFLRRGHAYVYRAYGLHCLLNVSSEVDGVGGGVLLRALEPIEGLAAMARDRGTSTSRDIARGPGRLAQAMGITLVHDGWDLCNRTTALWLGAGVVPRRHTLTSRRIGISRHMEGLLRFSEEGSEFVSGQPGRPA
jgi:DNA-3-methyladenine glycosylase